jgi:hypothetical protein
MGRPVYLYLNRSCRRSPAGDLLDPFFFFFFFYLKKKKLKKMIKHLKPNFYPFSSSQTQIPNHPDSETVRLRPSSVHAMTPRLHALSPLGPPRSTAQCTLHFSSSQTLCDSLNLPHARRRRSALCSLRFCLSALTLSLLRLHRCR